MPMPAKERRPSADNADAGRGSLPAEIEKDHERRPRKSGPRAYAKLEYRKGPRTYCGSEPTTRPIWTNADFYPQRALSDNDTSKDPAHRTCCEGACET